MFRSKAHRSDNDPDDLLGRADGQGLQRDRFVHSEYHGVEADAKSQRRCCHHGEARILNEHAKRVTDLHT
jgi:hypothetical protein